MNTRENIFKKSVIVLGVLFLGSCQTMQNSSPVEKPEFFAASWAQNTGDKTLLAPSPIGTQRPLIAQGRVFVAQENGNITSYNLRSGQEHWSFSEGKRLSSSPAIFKEHVFYGNEKGELVVRHAITGEEKYRKFFGAFIQAPPHFFKGRMILITRAQDIICADPHTGKELWRYRQAASQMLSLEGQASPVFYQNLVIVGFSHGDMVAFFIEDGSIMWEKKISIEPLADNDIDPLLIQQQLLVAGHGGSVQLLNPRSGKKIKEWDTRISSNFLRHQDKVYWGTLAGELQALDLKTWDLEQAVPLLKKSISQVVLWKKHLVLGAYEGKVYAFSQEDLSPQSVYEFGGKRSAIYYGLATDEEKKYLVMMSNRNRLRVFH